MFNISLFRLSLRQLAGRHRWFALFFLMLLAAFPAMIAMISANFTAIQDVQEYSVQLYENLTLALIVPALVLLVGSNALREEIQNQTIDYLYLKPVSRTGIVFSKFAGATVLTLVLTGASIVAAAGIFGESRFGVFLTAAGAAVFGYSALFFTLSLFFNRVIIWGFGYLLLWEGFLSNISQPASYLSLKRYVRSIEQALLGGSPEPSALTSFIVLLAVIVLGLGLSAWRLRTMEFPGSVE